MKSFIGRLLRKSLIFISIIVLVFGGVSPSLVSANSSSQANSKSAISIKLDPSYQHDPFEGWGTALVWFGNVTGGWPDEIKNELADALFSEEGLNFNIVRYNIGGGDSPETEPYMRKGGAVPGYWNRPAEFGPPEDADEDWKEMENWWDPDNPDHWNWEADKNQQWWLKAAKERGVNIFEAFSNSPPYFMTVSGYVSGHFDPNKDNLRSDQYTNFAIYLTRVVEYLEKEFGINIRTLSPVNEPNTNYWRALGRQEGSHWEPLSQAKIIKEVQKQLDELGLDTVVSAMDETHPQRFRTNWSAYDQETKDSIGQMNVHTYWPGERDSVRDLAKIENKRLWMSEVDLGGSLPQNHYAIEPGLELSERITSDIKNLEPAAWVLWQAIEDEVNMNHENENSNWGLIQVDFAPDDFDSLVWHKNKKYYVMGNYSKFIRPGYQIINTNNDNTLAAIDKKTNQLVIVYTNHTQTEQNVEFDLSGFNYISEYSVAKTYVTSATDNLAAKDTIDITGETLKATVGPKSVTTFVINDISGVSEDAGFFHENTEYKFINKNSGKAMDIGEDGSSVVQNDYDRYSEGQDWKLQKVTSGHSNKEVYKIIHVESGKVLTVADDGRTVVAEDTDSERQKWILSTYGNGDYTFVNVESEGVLEVYGQSRDNNATVGVWEPNSGANQKWNLVESGITKIEPVEVWTLPGNKPVLPDEVTVYFGDGTAVQKEVVWEGIDPEQYLTENKFTVEGTVDGTTLKAVATIFVSHIKNINPIKVKTALGIAPVLPDKVEADLNIGSTAWVPVEWENLNPSNYNQLGRFTVNGTVEGTNDTATAYVQVNERAIENLALRKPGSEYPKPSASFTGRWDDVNHINDGDYSSRRWTNWDPNEWRQSDWVQLDFGEEKVISEVIFTFYDDEDGTRPPKTLYLQYWDANEKEWVDIEDTFRDVQGEDVLVIPFETKTTSMIRVMMEAMEKACIAIVEMEVIGLGDNPVIGTDATLKNIFIDGMPIPDFVSSQFDYEIKMSQDRMDVPHIEVETNDIFATYEIDRPDELPGKISIKVTAEDQSTSKTYTLDFVAPTEEEEPPVDVEPPVEEEPPVEDETPKDGEKPGDSDKPGKGEKPGDSESPQKDETLGDDTKGSEEDGKKLPSTSTQKYNLMFLGALITFLAIAILYLRKRVRSFN